MLGIFKKLLDWLLPPHQSVRALEGETPETFLRFYSLQKTVNGMGLSSYKTPLVQAAITANKFYNDTLARHLLAALVARYLSTRANERLILVPIPLSSKRFRERGYNQVTEVLKLLPTEPLQHFTICPLLTRNLHTLPQTKLGRKQRLANLSNAFSVDITLLNTLPPTAQLIIIDDVTTTGATLQAARQTLTPHLSKNIPLECVALAH